MESMICGESISGVKQGFAVTKTNSDRFRFPKLRTKDFSGQNVGDHWSPSHLATSNLIEGSLGPTVGPSYFFK